MENREEHKEEIKITEEISIEKEDKESETKKVSAKLYTSMLTVGSIAFGGGTSTIPIFEKNCVDRDNLISTETFTDQIVVANITPGAVPIKLGCGIGMETKGVAGGIFGSWLVTLPGMILTVILVSLLGLVNEAFIQYLGYASIGVTVFVLFLMIEYITKIIKSAIKEKNLLLVLLIMIIAFILTIGGKVSAFLNGILGTNITYSPIFAVSVIDIIIACFYIILFTSGKFHRLKTPICVMIVIFYFLSVGEINLPDYFVYIAYGLIAVSLIVASIIEKTLKTKRHIKKSLNSNLSTENKGKRLLNELKPAIKIASIYLAFIVLYTLFLMIIDWKNAKVVLSYCLNGCLSVLTTFGGGAIYYPVAEGIFVEGGFITAQAFNIELITIVNAMPGPVLVKMLSAIGYKIGYEIAGSMLTGYLYSILGLFIGVGISGITFALIFKVFKFFGNIELFSQIRKFILPAICGLLLSTLISLVTSCFDAGSEAGVAGYYTILVIAAVYAATFFVCKKTKIPEIVPILAGGGLTLGLYSLLTLI